MSENDKPNENGSEESEGTEDNPTASEPRPIPEPLKFRESLDFTITKVGTIGSIDSGWELLSGRTTVLHLRTNHVPVGITYTQYNNIGEILAYENNSPHLFSILLIHIY